MKTIPQSVYCRGRQNQAKIRRTLILVWVLCVSCVSELRVAKVCLNFDGALDVKHAIVNCEFRRT